MFTGRRVTLISVALVVGIMTWGIVAGVSAAPLLSAAGSPTTTIALSDTTTTTIMVNTTTTTVKSDTTTTTIKSDTTTRTPITIRDLCPNILGVQGTIPAGMYINAVGRCVEDFCVKGGTGPGGGIVFYVAPSPQPWGRCMEAAPNTWNGGTADPSAKWGCMGTDITGANGSAIGRGRANTTAIITACPTIGIAARLADNLVFGGKSDWFLPSYNELGLMFHNRLIIGGFSSSQANWYWNAYNINAHSAGMHLFQFTWHVGHHDSKKALHRVRPIRYIP